MDYINSKNGLYQEFYIRKYIFLKDSNQLPLFGYIYTFMTCKNFDFILYKKQEIGNIVVYIKSAGLPDFFFFKSKDLGIYSLYQWNEVFIWNRSEIRIVML